MERPRRRSTKQTATTDFNAAHSAPTPVICHQTTRVDLRTGPLSPERPVQFLGPPSSWLTIRHSASSAAALHFPRVRSLEAFGRRPQWPAASVAKGRHPKPFTCVDGSGLARRIVTSQAWSVLPCVWPVCAVHMTAGHNALRGSGPGQKPAFENAVAHVGCPDRRIDRLCITCCSPSQPSHHARVLGAISLEKP